jgi:aminopeptidase YwaD
MVQAMERVSSQGKWTRSARSSQLPNGPHGPWRSADLSRRRGSVRAVIIASVLLLLFQFAAAPWSTNGLTAPADAAEPADGNALRVTSGDAIPPEVTLPDAAADTVGLLETTIDQADLRRHVVTLSADSLEGRAAGSRGGQAAAAYLQAELKRIPGLKPAGVAGSWQQPFGPQYVNILAQIPGRDPQQATEAVLIGAHYDHVGYGNRTNSNGPIGQIHNGADDNASGCALVLEMAAALAANEPPPRTIVFAFWDAEENGLLGSSHWVKQPSLPGLKLKLAINADMVGRMRDDRVAVMGWRSAADLRLRLATANGAAAIKLEFEPAVTSDSDHYPFFAGRIPILHVDTRKHDDYHRPSDDADRLNYAGTERLAECLARLIRQAASDPQLPAFRPEAWSERPAKVDVTARQSPPLRLGIAWDPKLEADGRFRVVQVVAGSAAEQVGLAVGDELRQLGSWAGGTAADLRTEISTAPSAPIPIGWVAAVDGRERSGTVTFAGEPVLAGLSLGRDPAVPAARVIGTVVRTSPADRSGLQPGDYVLSINGHPAPDPERWGDWVRQQTGALLFRVERAGQIRETTVALPAWWTGTGRSDAPPAP